jgi:hypothetical protein
MTQYARNAGFTLAEKTSLNHRGGAFLYDAAYPRVFLSHSGYEGEVKRVLDWLEKTLLAVGCLPIFDRRHIVAGTDYQPTIDEMIRVCDAAVFIISRRALSSDHTWVRDEANMLRYKMVQPEFQGIPVLIEGLKVTALDGWWDPTGLRSRDAITGNDARTIAADVGEALRPTRDRLRAEPVAAALAQKLLSLVGSEDALTIAAAPLGEGMIPTPVARYLALRLLQASSPQVVEVAKRLAVAYEKAAEAVLNLAFPFSLFDRAGPRALDAAIRRRQLAALNATKVTFTVSCYLLTGGGEYPPWESTVVEMQDGENLDEALSAADTEGGWKDGALEGTSYRRASTPTVVAIDCGRLTADVVDGCVAHFRDRPEVRILFVTRDATWDHVPSSLAARVQLIAPAVDAMAEQQARDNYADAKEELKIMIERDRRAMRGLPL